MMVHPVFQHNHYKLRRQVFALTGKVRLYAPDGSLLMYSEQKMFKLKEDIRVYADEAKTQELLNIKARNIIDFSAAYDVMDVVKNEKAGVFRRKGFRSMLRDQWEVLDAQDQLFGIMQEDSPGLAMARRFLSGLIPQNYDILLNNGQRVADLQQPFNPFRYELNLDFSMDTARVLDHRLGIAGAILLAIIEGRQD